MAQDISNTYPADHLWAEKLKLHGATNIFVGLKRYFELCHSNINRSLAASTVHTVHTVHAVTSMLWKISSVPSSGTLFSIDFLSSPCIQRPIRLAFSRKTQLAFQACRIDRSDRWCVEYEELGLRHDLHLGFRWQMVLWWCRNWRVWNTPRNLSTCETANDIWIFVLPTFTFRETFLLHRGYCQLSIALPFPSAAGTGSGHKIHAPMSSKAQLKEWQMSRWVFSGGLESYPSHKTHRGPRRLRVMRMGLLPLASSWYGCSCDVFVWFGSTLTKLLLHHHRPFWPDTML